MASDPVPRWNLQPDKPDEWDSRFPAEYIIGDLTETDLQEWRAMCRREEANGYIVPHTTTPIDPRTRVAIPREMQNDPALDWMRGRNPHAQIGERAGWKPFRE